MAHIESIDGKPRKNLFGPVFFLHTVLILCAYISPIVLPWTWVVVGVFLYLFQNYALGGCILSRWQFGGTFGEVSFYETYLRLLGFETDRAKLVRFVSFVVPALIAISAVIIQKGLGVSPLLF